MDTTPADKLAYTVTDVREVTGIGRTQIYEAVSSGALPAKKRGLTTLILRDDLLRWLNGLPAYTPNRAKTEAAVVARRAKTAKRRAEAQEAAAAAERRTAAKTRRANVETRTAG
jgi:excisionase family DNA binding protein